MKVWFLGRKTTFMIPAEGLQFSLPSLLLSSLRSPHNKFVNCFPPFQETAAPESAGSKKLVPGCTRVPRSSQSKETPVWRVVQSAAMQVPCHLTGDPRRVLVQETLIPDRTKEYYRSMPLDLKIHGMYIVPTDRSADSTVPLHG